MDAYTLHLLGVAVENVVARYEDGGGGFHLHPPHRGSGPKADKWMLSRGADDFHADTLAESLAALLTDLGVTVPERPSAERVAELGTVPGLRSARSVYAREPLTVISMLEGGGS